IPDYISLLSFLYLGLVIYYIGKLFYQYGTNRNLLYDEAEAAGEEIEFFIDQLKYITGLKRKIQVWVSANINIPLTTGFLKPIILLPVSAVTQLTSRQIEALIAHEFFHIKRNDYLVNMLTSFAEAFLFFNPFAKLILKAIGNERENCCDDEVIRLGYDRWEYAQALYTLGKNNQQAFHFALAATGHGKQLLLERVRRLLKAGACSKPSFKKPLTVFFLCLFMAGSVSRVAETNEPVRVAAIGNMPVYPAVYISQPEVVIVARKPAVKCLENHPKKKIKAPEPNPAPTPQQPEIMEAQATLLTPTFISNNTQIISYTLIEAPISTAQKPENCDPSLPYTPASTFYFPEHDIHEKIDGKTIIHL
ncbi:MAG: M56 family metallopeptidase, partial [Chitinophagaceae bacterium]|nr:M56 family metallopeptidase [Chitinophagaceae bacterium]